MVSQRIHFVTLFPNELQAFFEKGLIKKAIDNDLITVNYVNIRQFAINKYGQIDDPPFGGKRGMLLRVDVLYHAITSIPGYESATMFATCPKGDALNQTMASTIHTESTSDVIIISGYYEGFDDRIFQLLPIRRFSIGNIILSSGDPAAIALAEAITRLIPGVIGDPECINDDSYVSGLLEYPQYAPPRVFQNHAVPDILLSGHHQKIATWKRKQSLGSTLALNPELFADASLTDEDKALLTDFLKE